MCILYQYLGFFTRGFVFDSVIFGAIGGDGMEDDFGLVEIAFISGSFEEFLGGTIFAAIIEEELAKFDGAEAVGGELGEAVGVVVEGNEGAAVEVSFVVLFGDTFEFAVGGVFGGEIEGFKDGKNYD